LDANQTFKSQDKYKRIKLLISAEKTKLPRTLRLPQKQEIKLKMFSQQQLKMPTLKKPRKDKLKKKKTGDKVVELKPRNQTNKRKRQFN
jgi:hypothetical protein